MNDDWVQKVGTGNFGGLGVLCKGGDQFPVELGGQCETTNSVGMQGVEGWLHVEGLCLCRAERDLEEPKNNRQDWIKKQRTSRPCISMPTH